MDSTYLAYDYLCKIRNSFVKRKKAVSLLKEKKELKE